VSATPKMLTCMRAATLVGIDDCDSADVGMSLVDRDELLAEPEPNDCDVDHFMPEMRTPLTMYRWKMSSRMTVGDRGDRRPGP